MDYEDMDRKIRENHIHTAIFCSPNNPTGRVWERNELEKAMEIYRKNNVYVISDEIWSDLIMPDYKHIPTQMVSEDAKMRTVSLYAPSKTFNLAGLVGSYHIIYNDYLRDRIDKESSLCHYNEMNVMSMHGLIGAYSETGELWLEELIQVLEENIQYAVDYIENHFPDVETTRPQGTYMLFVDFEKWCKKRGVTIDTIEKKAWDVGVGMQDGRIFGGDYTVRMNLALPFELVKEAMDRLNKYVISGE